MHIRTDADGVVWTSADEKRLEKYIDDRNSLIAECRAEITNAQDRHKITLDVHAALNSTASQGRIT